MLPSVFVGIDYSLSSPAVCVHTGEEWSFQNCKFYFLQKKPTVVSDPMFCSTEYPLWSREEERFGKLAGWASFYIPDGSKVCIEGYAFSANGRVFNIAENTGLLKYSLYRRGMPVDTVPPTTVKKFATGKGNADKLLMQENFEGETGVNIQGRIGVKPNAITPSSDIIDAYFIAKWHFTQHKATTQHENTSVPGPSE